MLKQFSHSALTPEELVTMAERLIHCVAKSEHKEILTNRIAKTTDAANYLTEALNESLSSVHASRVQQADLERDDAFQAFKYGALSASYRSELTIKKAGETLVEIVRKQGFSLYNLGYIAQSEAMRTLMTDLEQCQGEIMVTGIADLQEEMMEANDRFNQIYHEKLDENSDQETPQIVVGKGELSKQITLFLNHVELLEEDHLGGVSELVENINELIQDMVTQARDRQRG
ncbi:MAG: DUF6261 family protein [Cytophagales bacterium]|nr:DUF6261 family protein [Cytophagales bacterium]